MNRNHPSRSSAGLYKPKSAIFIISIDAVRTKVTGAILHL